MPESSPKSVVAAWVEALNRGNADEMAAFYHETATDHQVLQGPVHGREAIRAMFARGFMTQNIVCIPENLFEDGDWVILEWKDPWGARGRGFFLVENGRIAFQRCYRQEGPLAQPAAKSA